MNADKENSQKRTTSLVVLVCGVVLAIVWLLVGFTSVLSMSAGWIFSIVLTVVSCFVLANLNSVSKLKQSVWAFLVAAILAQTVAYVLSLTGLSPALTALLAGIVGGAALEMAALAARQS